jgi:uncharacterized protein (DUF433 family)
VFANRQERKRVETWVNAQETCPSRKEIKRAFPEADLKHIRAALQSRKDRERRDQT